MVRFVPLIVGVEVCSAIAIVCPASNLLMSVALTVMVALVFNPPESDAKLDERISVGVVLKPGLVAFSMNVTVASRKEGMALLLNPAATKPISPKFVAELVMEA